MSRACPRAGGAAPILALLALLALVLRPALAAEPAPPPALEALQESEGTGDVTATGLEIRNEAMREAALSYGARGGLAWRTFEIRAELARHADRLDQIWNFRRLLIPAPSGLMMEPPVIGETLDALKLEDEGQIAALADQVLKIAEPARIVTAARDWRTYLERDWGEVVAPPALLMPQSAEERERWRGWVSEGWEAGIAQADEIFETDLARLARDFTGMVRYRMLLAQAKVSAPYALEELRGVTGGGTEMRVGDRGVRITGPALLQPSPDQWQPTDR